MEKVGTHSLKMAGSAIALSTLASIVIANILGQPVNSSPVTTAGIQFSSVLDSDSERVEINCKNSVKQIVIGEGDSQGVPNCPLHLDYWMKHLVLYPEQQTTLTFVPGYDSERIADWCWNCDFDWGKYMIPEMFIFANLTTMEQLPWTTEDVDIVFQIRSSGIYQRIRYGQDGEFETYMLVKRWVPKEEFTCTKEGKFRDPFECNKFHVCEAVWGGFVHNKFTCPEASTVYCEEEDTCGYEYECPC